MKKILFITPNPIHSNVGNAGAKTLLCYFDLFNKSNEFSCAIAYTGNHDDDYNLMLNEYPNTPFFSYSIKKGFFNKVYDFFRFTLLYPKLKLFIPRYYATNGFIGERLTNNLESAKKNNFIPDIIIVEFTTLILWVNKVKEIFPQSILVASSHDVTFLSVKRFFNLDNKSSFFSKWYYSSFKRKEIECLKQFDVIVLHNEKDKVLLKQEGFAGGNLISITPWFDRYKLLDNLPKIRIVFFGAMSRAENFLAVEWFLDNVWPQLNQRLGSKAKFTIVGSGIPKNKVEKFDQSPNVERTGFLKDPSVVFSEAVCFVVPLHLGAGIKVKVLEAMSAGIPVVTNDIGIEGIPAKPGIDYLHCNTVEDYLSNITALFEQKHLQTLISEQSQKLIMQNFSISTSFENYKSILLSQKRKT